MKFDLGPLSSVTYKVLLDAGALSSVTNLAVTNLAAPSSSHQHQGKEYPTHEGSSHRRTTTHPSHVQDHHHLHPSTYHPTLEGKIEELSMYVFNIPIVMCYVCDMSDKMTFLRVFFSK